MAKIGLQYLVYKGATGNSGSLAKAIQADYAITLNEAKLHADDSVAESDKSFRDGTLTLGVDDLNDTIQSELLGHAIDSGTGEITANGNDNNPYVGVGFVSISKLSGVQKFVSTWLPKTQFGEPSVTNQTKGESTQFSTPTMTGTIMLDDDGDWKKENKFATLALAKAYLDDKAGITAMCTTPVSSLASGTYTALQAAGITLSAGAGETIYYTTDGTTPSATNGTEYTAAIDITETCALRAISTKTLLNNSYVATYEYIISA
jgi:phi13 family phage major tail protein